MNKNGPILVIEDDPDDSEVYGEIFQKLELLNDVIYFNNGHDALAYLVATDIQPFLVLSDINMPKLNGLELKGKVFINKKLQARCTPYLFFSTSASKHNVDSAYALSAQGFFVKPNTMKAWEDTLRVIISYWKQCVSPNEFTERPVLHK